MTAWRRILIYLGLVKAPGGDVGKRLLPWWAQLGSALVLLGIGVTNIALGSAWLGVLPVLLAVFLTVDAVRRRSRG